MNGKLRDLKTDGVDSGDAPELTDEFLEHAEWKIGDRLVSPTVGIAALNQATLRGRPPSEHPKRSVTVRYDVEVIEAFKATGKGWQTRMNQALKEWLSSSGLTFRS
jgi:uncharacterized protein (DUF4415 family)